MAANRVISGRGPLAVCRRTAAAFVLVAAAAALAGCNEPPRIVDQFARLWYDRPDTWRTTRWFGIVTHQNPMDVWMLQEILYEVKPDLMVECGAFHGGSAALWATILEEINPDARIISIDIEDRMQEARKLPVVERRVEFIVGSSTSPDVVARVRERAAGKRVVVLLDSDHSRAHVLEELRSYAPVVGVGSYLIVQDTNINGHPVLPEFGPGPWEAVEEFLRDTAAFEVDRSRERLLFTFSPNGYLKRVRE